MAFITALKINSIKSLSKFFFLIKDMVNSHFAKLTQLC